MPSTKVAQETQLIPEAVLETRGPVVLALPGGGCSPRIYEAIRLHNARLHALDWTVGPGPFDPVSIATRIGTQLAGRAGTTVMAGHSLGGFVALLVALQSPQHVTGLILSNTGAYSAAHGDQTLPERIRSDWHAGTQADFLRACFHVPPPPDLWAHLLDYLARVPQALMLEAVTGLRQMDARERLKDVACPTLVAHGQFDKRRLVSAAEELAAGIPGAQLVLLPGGHTPMVDCPAQYQAAVDTFLARVLART